MNAAPRTLPALAGLLLWLPRPSGAGLVPETLAARMAEVQQAIDPLMPALLAIVLLLAAALGLRSRRHARVGALGVAPIGGRRWLAVMAVALAFGLLAAAVNGRHTSHRLLQWDATVAAAAQAQVGAGAQQVLRWISDLGDVLVLTPLVAAVSIGLLWRGRGALALGGLLAVLGNSLAVRVLKNLFERPRPPGADELLTSGASFPSGHAAGALLVYGLLLWLVLPLAPSRRGRAWLALAGGALIGAIVASRVLLRVHFVSDVVGGLLLSGCTLLLATALLRPWRPAG